MARQAHEEFFDSQLAAVLQDGGIQVVHVVTEGGSPPGSANITMMHHPRLVVCTQGTGHYRILRNSEPAELTLQTREGIYLSPGSWISTSPTQRYESLGLCILPTFTRYLAIRFNPMKQSAKRLRPWAWHHARGVADVDVIHFCEALTRGASRSPEEPYLRHLFTLLLLAARELLHVEDSPPPRTGFSQAKAYASWQAVSQYVLEHCHRPDLSRTEVADYLGIHPNHVSRLFATFSNESFSQFVRHTRLELAQNLLVNSTLSIAEIAHECGFSEAGYFIRLFRRQYKTTPSRYRAASL